MSGGYYQRKPKDDHCRNGCGVRLKWDTNLRSPSGKQIPLELETGKKHDCPNNPYNQKQSSSGNALFSADKPQSGEGAIGTYYTESPKVSYSQQQEATEIAEAKAFRDEATGILAEILVIVQRLDDKMKENQMLLNQVLHPNPTIAKASDMKKSTEIHSELGLSDDDPEDNDVEDSEDRTDHNEERFEP